MAGKPQTLSKGQKDEVVRIFRKKLLKWMAIFFAILTGITGMSLWSIWQCMETKMEDLVAKQFGEPQIQEVVRQAAAEQASVLMSEQITPEVNKFKAEIASAHKEVRTEIYPLIVNLRDEYSQTFEHFKKEQEKYATVTLLNKLIIQATNGNKNAAITLVDMSKNLNPEYLQIAKDAMKGTYEKYFSSKFSYEYFQSIIPDHEVIKRLDEENFLERKRAVGTIRKRKMCKQIPNLISRLKTETHLAVIGEIERTLNSLLDTKIKSLNLEEVTGSYMKIWESKKNILLN